MLIIIKGDLIMSLQVDKKLDATGLACPMPVVRVRTAMDQMNTGELLEVHATDRGSKSDLTVWTKSSGHELVDQAEENGIYKFWIRKK